MFLEVKGKNFTPGWGGHFKCLKGYKSQIKTKINNPTCFDQCRRQEYGNTTVATWNHKKTFFQKVSMKPFGQTKHVCVCVCMCVPTYRVSYC